MMTIRSGYDRQILSQEHRTQPQNKNKINRENFLTHYYNYPKKCLDVDDSLQSLAGTSIPSASVHVFGNVNSPILLPMLQYIDATNCT